MAFKDLSQEEIARFLQSERIIRVGMDANGERYLVPLGYVWHDGWI